MALSRETAADGNPFPVRKDAFPRSTDRRGSKIDGQPTHKIGAASKSSWGTVGEPNEHQTKKTIIVRVAIY